MQACVIAPGKDLNAIRSILGPVHRKEFGPPKGTLFLTPGSELESMALEEMYAEIRVSPVVCIGYYDFDRHL